ncbi:nicotinate-nucleotide adenylyltransferase [Pseudoprimorskyibacter insulae]|uniref:Probable nicotinate-nucleotide adenylyltransferase n=1 Tax=Pseudoprimorskyibacter insulae TaxID=1695997 RepID=A0A2R8AQL1_9RHOB|nr:nicotinate-nucleotide adenylyltransferase [Pseudoprimorskyibacter insulae]SPF78260.1 putative nicotinate-nucleotide adenylyltransferase [Pseudoprimorskyibacter insulae]
MERLGHLRPGMRVGLLGGSFDPAHEGHAHITRTALTRFGLDRVVWLVSPGNPLKDRGPAPIADRIAAAKAVMQHPRVIISDYEARTGTRYTAQTVANLRRAHPGVRFVWLMGADNLRQFSQWQDWQQIMETVPIGVLARPGVRMKARCGKAARIYSTARWAASDARGLALADAPAWCFINLPMSDASSTQIRKSGRWRHGPRD